MIKILSENSGKSLQKMDYAELHAFKLADLYSLYNKGYRDFESLQRNIENCKAARSWKAIFYKACRVYATMLAKRIYYIYRASQYLPPINEKEQKLPTSNWKNYLLENPHEQHPAKTNSTILALDLGSNTGWAIRSSDTTISSGTVRFRQQRFEGGGMIYLRFKQWLTQIKNSVGAIDAVYFEEVRRHIGTDAAHAYGGFMAHLTAWCEHHDIPYQGVPVGTIKKHIAGRGNASKQEVMAAIQAKGFEPEDDNEADALALLDLVLNTYNEGE